MRKFNPVPYRFQIGVPLKTRSQTLDHLLDDPKFIDSVYSHFVQIADIVGYCLSKHLFDETVPTKFRSVRTNDNLGLRNLFPILDPVLCKKAAPKHPLEVKIISDN